MKSKMRWLLMICVASVVVSDTTSGDVSREQVARAQSRRPHGSSFDAALSSLKAHLERGRSASPAFVSTRKVRSAANSPQGGCGIDSPKDDHVLGSPDGCGTSPKS